MNDLKDMDCAGRAQRRRRFGPREGRWFWWSARQILRQSGVACEAAAQAIIAAQSAGRVLQA